MPALRRFALLVVLVIGATGGAAAISAGSSDSRASGTSAPVQSNGSSLDPAVSLTGRFVAFDSDASNLVPGDSNGLRDVFWLDRSTGQIMRLVNRGGPEPNGISALPSISGDGRFVVFSSAASNLVAGDKNGKADVFLYDTQQQITRRVSVTPTGGDPNGASITPVISSDGRWVAFSSAASNLVAGDKNGKADVFLYDTQQQITRRVSVTPTGGDPNGASITPVISSDGRWVAFSSAASNLVAGDKNGKADVFLYDTQQQITRRVSVTPTGGDPNGASLTPAISADGSTVAFSSFASTLVGNDANGTSDIYLAKPLTSGEMQLISRSTAGKAANSASTLPALSADGTTLAFLSEASDLVAGDHNRLPDIFLYSTTSKTIRRATLPTSEGDPNGLSLTSSLSSDGGVLSFSSLASNLVADDTNRTADIFVLTGGKITLVSRPASAAPPPPAPTIDSHPGDPTNQISADFGFSDTQDGVRFECQLDGGAFSACTSPQHYPGPLSDGQHTFKVRALDAAGNQSDLASFNWTVSTVVPPAPTIDSHPGDPTNQISADFGFSDTQDGVRFECQLDGGAFSACTSPQHYPGPLSDGQHTFKVRALDAAGNQSDLASFNWTVSTVVPPAPTIDSHPGDPTNQISADFGFSDTQDGVRFECQLDGDAFAACSSPQQYAGPLSDGQHTFKVRALDAAGNQSDPASFNWTVSTVVPPAPTIDSHPGDPTNQISADFGFSDTQDGVRFECQLDGDAFAACSSPQQYAGPLSDGQHTFKVRALDAAGNQSDPVSFSWTVDTTRPPAPTIDSHPGDPTNARDATFTFSASPEAFAPLSSPFAPFGTSVVRFECQLDGGAFSACSSPQHYMGPLADGLHTFQVRALDAAGNPSDPASFSWTVDATPPPAPTIDAHPDDPTRATDAHFTFSDAEQAVSFLCRLNGADFAACTSPQDYSGLAAGPQSFEVNAVDAAGNQSDAVSFSWTVSSTAPPVLHPPPNDPTVATSIADSTKFLYTGPNAPQTGMTATISPQRVAVVNGRVLDRDGAALEGVQVSILNHPEYGQTLTRHDGAYDLVVNGGGQLVVAFAKDGYLPVQHQLQTPWQDYTALPHVVMIAPDPNVTTIDTAATSEQVARGSSETDTSGTRQATLLFAPGTTATMTLPDGTTQPLSTLHVHATEFTVGSSGPQAMPGDLPAASGYTYAVDYSVDEATASGASDVRFNQPVAAYTENFLHFATGTVVPVGYYDPQRGVWVPSTNGRVIAVLAVVNGKANLDIDGSGTAATTANLATLGITDAERQQLAQLYSPGETLWRVPVSHFSPWDFNWSREPKPPVVVPQAPPTPPDDDDQCHSEGGSDIGCETQTLGEDVPVTGTPYTLHYSSVRTPGSANYSLEIPLSGTTVSPSLKRIDLEIFVAGEEFTHSFSPGANQHYTFTWDGKDRYGRTVTGPQRATIELGYVYPMIYTTAGPSQNGMPVAGYDAIFGHYSWFGTRATADEGRGEITLWADWTRPIGGWDARGIGLGGWTLDVQHSYDPSGQRLYQGDGRQYTTSNLDPMIDTVAGSDTPPPGPDNVPATQASLNSPEGVAVGPDGSVYISEFNGERVRRVSPDGVITTIAGTGQAGFGGDGGPATNALLNGPTGITVGPDGSLYIAEFYNGRIRKVATNGTISTIAGGGVHYNDGFPATQAQLVNPSDVKLGSDGSVFIVTFGEIGHTVRRVAPDGIITTVAGGGGATGDGGPANQARLYAPSGLAIGPDDSLYISDNNSVRRVGPDGIINTVAGGNGLNGGFGGDGGPATQAYLSNPHGLAVGPDGSVYIADQGNFRVRRVGPDGIITTVAGSGSFVVPIVLGDRGPATRAKLSNPTGVALGPDGSLYIADHTSGDDRVRRVGLLPAATTGSATTIVPSRDGTQLFTFDTAGRHLKTLDALTGSTIYSFTYDTAGRLATITDRSGNTTRIERNPDGSPAAIIAPFGQRTTLTTDANGYLSSIADPASNTITLSTPASGLLASYTDPRGNTSTFTYDNFGRLTRDAGPDGYTKTLTRTDATDGWTVTITTGLGRTTGYQVQELPNHTLRRTVTAPDGTRTVLDQTTDATATFTQPDGTVTKTTDGPDPRFGMRSPITTSYTLTTPNGITYTATASRQATLADPLNPLSLSSLTDTEIDNGKTTTTTYDGSSRAITTTSPAGRTYSATLDAQGKVTDEHPADLAPTSYAYDSHGELTTITQGAGDTTRTATFAYDTLGRVSVATDPLHRTTILTYDAADRVIAATLAGGRVVGYAYDPASNLAALTTPNNTTYTFEHTSRNLLSSFTAPQVGDEPNTTSYAYNSDGQPSAQTNPGQTPINVGYDAAGRLTDLTFDRGTIHTSYNPTTGALASMSAPDGLTLTFTDDGPLPVTDAATGPVASTVTRTFNSDLRTSGIAVNGTNSALSYDADGLLTATGAMSISRDPHNGLPTGATLGAVTDGWTYDQFADLATATTTAAGASVYSVSYQRDMVGRITSKTETLGGQTHTTSYTYDPAGRLSQVQADGTTTATYTYDANGNRLTTTTPAGTTTATYDNQDRVSTAAGTSYTYNPAGQLQQATQADGSTTTYTYDQLGNLTTVHLPDGRTIDYLIDGANRRVGKKINSTLVQGFLYQDGLRPVAELDGQGNTVSRFIYGDKPNVPEYLIKGGTTYRIVTDQLGSPRLVVNTSSGQTVQRIDYDAWGNITTDTNPGFQPFGFAGGLYDPDTTLVRFGSRDYSPSTGRWMAKDSILFASGDSNLYEYARNDPLNLTDSVGTEPKTPCPPPKPAPPKNRSWWDRLLDWVKPPSAPVARPTPTLDQKTRPGLGTWEYKSLEHDVDKTRDRALPAYSNPLQRLYDQAADALNPPPDAGVPSSGSGSPVAPRTLPDAGLPYFHP